MTQKKFDKKKLESYNNLLNKLRDEIVHNIKNIAHDADSDNSGDVSRHVMHMADVATDMYDREFNMGLASNEREILQQIEVALKKVEDQSFGFCVECEKSIPEARLKAIPYAETCLKCQEKIESEK